MFDRGVVPRRLVLCDVPAKHSELKQLAGEVRSVLGYRGKTEIALSAGTAPPEVYRCGFIIGATNMRGILDVKQLAAGTIVVDDSFPHCFDTELAIQRMASRSDVLLVDGGFVLPRGPIEWIATLPTVLAGQLGNYYETELMPSTSTITGCILSALLSKAHGATASIGPVSLDISKGHWEVLQRLGIGAAPLRCGHWLVPEAALAGMLDHSRDRRANNVL
jgi:hypothetical protein